MTRQIKELYKEYPNPNEDQEIDAIWQEIAARQKIAKESSEKVNRGFNSKTSGAFIGYLDILDNAAPYNVGLFGTVATYKVMIRFGGGSSKILTDENKKDPCGISLKVIDAPSEKITKDDAGLDSQNFVFLNTNAMFVPNLSEFHRLMGYQMSGNKLGVLFYCLNPFGGHRFGHRISQFRNIMSLCGQRLGNDLSAMRYWSTTPYAFGAKACKYKLVPQPTNTKNNVPLQITGFDFLRENIETIIQDHDLNFDFQIQLQRDAEAQPIEIASVVWDETKAPLETVAKLRIPKQESNTELFELADELSFDPWTSAEEHRPLGGLNRARRKIYSLSYRNRKQPSDPLKRQRLLELFPAE